MIQVLFVDDDTSAVDSLASFLSAGEIGWDLTRASSADEALGLMVDRIFDVIIASGSSKSIDAADLLARVRDASPDVMRILAIREGSGSLNKRLLPQAHQIVHNAND